MGRYVAPDRIQQFVAVRDELLPPARWLRAIPGLGSRCYSERWIDPVDEYVVAGQPECRHGAIVFTGILVIGDRSPTAIVTTRLWNAAFPLLVATGFVLVGIWGIFA